SSDFLANTRRTRCNCLTNSRNEQARGWVNDLFWNLSNHIRHDSQPASPKATRNFIRCCREGLLMTILFSNPPMWQIERAGEQQFLRGGIRAGSRWPFTRRSPYKPDEFRFGSYMPYPFFLGSAAAYV